MDEVPPRSAAAPVKFRLLAQRAAAGDPVNDGSAVWPAERETIGLGTISLTATALSDQPTAALPPPLSLQRQA